MQRAIFLRGSQFNSFCISKLVHIDNLNSPPPCGDVYQGMVTIVITPHQVLVTEILNNYPTNIARVTTGQILLLYVLINMSSLYDTVHYQGDI